jgi:hypothetical protein
MVWIMEIARGGTGVVEFGGNAPVNVGGEGFFEVGFEWVGVEENPALGFDCAHH